ncbi:MAG: hypothetical protein F4Z28_15625, partial [Gammaproteobacteria bacterium]|nr:hypothetical protein [Gammaproteobacteria bacterium]
MQPTNPTETPILNTPYDPPAAYWSLDRDFRACAPALPGRRPSGAYLPVPKPQSRQNELPIAHSHESCLEVEPHRRINQIRDAVQSWREAGYPGATTATMELLDHWNEPDTEGIQPYFCQRDAVETAIYLVEAQDDCRAQFEATLGDLNEEHNEGIPRIALKLATGTGKTFVMAMLILWQAKNGYCQDFLLLVPNLTIRDRLAELKSGSPLYEDLRPMGDETRFRVTVLNFQAWQRRAGVGIEGSITDKQKRAIGLDPEAYKNATMESEDEMIERLLAAHRGGESLCVMNDEAHHCYNGQRARGGKIAGESAKEEADAMVWFGAMQTLQRRGRISQVYDLSATPMWLRRPTPNEPSVIFPWAVSDYPLVDAIEAGLVKIPRVPIRDQSGLDIPAFRNLHVAVKTTVGETALPAKGQPLPKTLEDALGRMHRDYERIRRTYETRGITPILIVVADTIENAERLFAELGGWRIKDEWVPGRFSVLSNIEGTGKVKDRPLTLLVHSRMDEKDKDDSLAGSADKSDNSAIHAPDEKLSAVERMGVIRTLFNTAGKKGEPGEYLRCIVSVGMLTEGWDAKAVTHVVGYRNFGSDLLCEQVAGRALRRSVVPEPGAEQTAEYANIVGIPFLNMPSEEKGNPGESKKRWSVHALPDRAHQRMELPRIRGWRRDQPGPRASLNTPLGDLDVRSNPGTGEVSLLGEGGEKLVLGMGSEREQTACWRLASRVLARCKVDYDGEASLDRLESFASVVRATENYLLKRGIKANGLTTDATTEAVSADIAKHLVWSDADERIVAALHDPALASTAERQFDTTLLRYPEHEAATTLRSELNAAACHSDFERRVAAMLDRADGIDAWVRNYRLDWSMPWHDPLHARWHEYEPDFVARVPLNGSRALLVIEVKGRPDLRSDEKARAAR